jgi:hypothetical protein
MADPCRRPGTMLQGILCFHPSCREGTRSNTVTASATAGSTPIDRLTGEQGEAGITRCIIAILCKKGNNLLRYQCGGRVEFCSWKDWLWLDSGVNESDPSAGRSHPSKDIAGSGGYIYSVYTTQ